MAISAGDEVVQELERGVRGVLARASLAPELAGAVVRGVAGALPDAPRLALIATEAPGVQRLIGASRRVVTRLGASDTLAGWDAALRNGPAPGVARDHALVLWAGGGKALILAAADDAEKIRGALETAYGELQLGQLVLACRTCSPRELVEGPAPAAGYDATALRALGIDPGGSGFAGLLAQLHVQLDARRDALSLEAATSAPRCVECGQRGAATSGDEGPICAICGRLHGAGSVRLGKDGVPRTLDNFESGNLAWLYLDGARVGMALRRCRDLAEYVAFSRDLLAAFDWEAARRDLERAGVREAVPLVRGGDDLGMVFDAKQGAGAFTAALAVLEGVAARVKAAGLGVGAGAGLVVSNSLGARQAVELAQQLVKRAKTAAPEGVSFGLDLELVDGGDVLGDELEDLRPERNRPVTSPPQRWTWRRLELTTRPWTLEQAREIRAIHDQIDAEMPDGFKTLRRVGAALDEDLFQGLSLGRTLLDRQRARDGSRSLWTLLGGADGVPQPDAAQGWVLRAEQRPDPDRRGKTAMTWRTAVLDLVELERLHRGRSSEVSDV